jgi:hypothetical protein
VPVEYLDEGDELLEDPDMNYEDVDELGDQNNYMMMHNGMNLFTPSPNMYIDG